MFQLDRFDITFRFPINIYTSIACVIIGIILLGQAYNWYKYRHSGATLIYNPRGVWSFPNFHLFKGKVQKNVIQKNYPLNWGISYLPPFRLKLYSLLFAFTAFVAVGVLFLDVKDNYDNTESTKQFNKSANSINEFLYSIPKMFGSDK